jgi:hypothetical protein
MGSNLERFMETHLNPKRGMIIGGTLAGLTYFTSYFIDSKTAEDFLLISFSTGVAIFAASAIDYGENRLRKEQKKQNYNEH